MTRPLQPRLRRELRDARDRVVGCMPMAIDHTEEGLLHAVVVRSVVPHGRILGIDRDEALDAPGVVAVITGEDLAMVDHLDPWFGHQRRDQPVLATDTVRHAGEAVALVVAETPRQAAAAAELVLVDVEELPHVTDAEEAGLPGAPQLHEDWPGNACGHWQLHRGDVDAAIADAHLVLTGTFTTPTASHVPMEPHAAVAWWTEGGDDASPRLEVLSSTQSPHMATRSLKEIFGIDDVVVRTVNLGGGYGAKGQTKIEPLAAVAAWLTESPVKLVLDREGVFATIGRHAGTVHMTTAVDADGRIVARDIDVTYNAGAYCVTTAGATGQGLVRAPGPYVLPNIRVRSRGFYTNTVPTGPFRGAMTSQVCLAYETQLDEIADRLGIDRLEIRRRNVLHDGDTYATGEALHDLRYDELLDRTVAAVGWDDPLDDDGPVRRGRGLGIMIKSTLTPSRSEAVVEVDGEGTVTLHAASVEMGQGASSTLLLLLGEALDMDPDDIVLPAPNTGTAPFDTTTASSRTTYSMGNAVRKAAAELRDVLDALACGGQPPPHPLTHRDGCVVTPDGPVPYADLAARAGGTVRGHGVHQTTGGLKGVDPMDVKGTMTPHYHQGAAAVEVAVDTETGRIEVARAVGSAYAGRVISPLRVDQQNVGCVVMALGAALFEQLVHDEGQPTNPNLSDYMIPSILDVPPTVGSVAVEQGDADAELHGVGEMAFPPLAPAVVSAVHQATGVWLRDLPLTPEKVLRAIAEQADTPEETR